MSTPMESTLAYALRHRPWTVVFYSFRGGVGRTSALLSTAQLMTSCTLAVEDASGVISFLKSASRIAVIDFDLEAPGIDAFPSLAPENPQQKGLVEFLEDSVADPNASPNLRDYVYEKKWRDGTLVIMRAGRQDLDYRKALARLDFDRLYRFDDGELILDNLRAGLKSELGCDFLLVDSRTGITEIGGVCLGHLADACVLVFQPTEAHTKGLPEVVAQIKQREQREDRLIPRLYFAAKTPLSRKDRFDPDAVALACNLVMKCGEKEPESVDKVWLNDTFPDFQSRGDCDFIHHEILVFSPIVGIQDLVGNRKASQPEAYLSQSILSDPDSGNIPVAFSTSALFALDSHDQVLKWEQEKEETSLVGESIVGYLKNYDDNSLNEILQKPFGRAMFRKMLPGLDMKQLPIEHQAKILQALYGDDSQAST